MPYIITTTRPSEAASYIVPGQPRTVTRRAVATLYEANRAAYEYQRRADARLGQYNAQRVSDSGGTIGPLPDGTTIAVERVAWEALMAANKMRERGPTTFQIIDAYNANQEH